MAAATELKIKNINEKDLLKRALSKGEQNERLSKKEALAVAKFNLEAKDIISIGKAAFLNKEKRFGKKVSWIHNLHINSSNICHGNCTFCAFAVSPNNPKSYILTEEEIVKSIEDHQPEEVHIVGGLNEEWDFKRNLSLLRTITKEYPTISIKGFTAVEIDFFAKETEKSTNVILKTLQEAGLKGMPGGGAEIFSNRMRKILCPEKLSGEKWLSIHKEAHNLGLWTNATLLYNCGETAKEQVDHLIALRNLQDETGGFSSFIPLLYQPENNSALEQIQSLNPEYNLNTPSPAIDLKVIALARLVLDNIPHIKAYWPMIGIETAATGLSYGADDLDGTLGKERIAHSAGATSPHSLTQSMMEETITLAGYKPWERTSDFTPQTRKTATTNTNIKEVMKCLP